MLGDGSLGFSVAQNELRTYELNKAADAADAQNASYAVWSAAVGAVAVLGVWYFFLRGKSS